MNEAEDLKQQLAQLKQAYQIARVTSDFKGGFLARSSHELRSPLNSIMGLQQLVLEDLCENPEEERKFIKQAQEHLRKMFQMLEDLVAISKLDTGRGNIQLENISVGDILEDLYHRTYMVVKSSNLQLEIIPPSAPIYCLTDRQKLLQSMVMLIDFAISLLRGGKIKVEAQEEPEQKIVKISLQLSSLQLSESVDFLNQEWQGEMISPGMKMLLAQNILESIQAKLIIASPITEEKGWTCLECLLPQG